MALRALKQARSQSRSSVRNDIEVVPVTADSPGVIPDDVSDFDGGPSDVSWGTDMMVDTKGALDFEDFDEHAAASTDEESRFQQTAVLNIHTVDGGSSPVRSRDFDPSPALPQQLQESIHSSPLRVRKPRNFSPRSRSVASPALPARLVSPTVGSPS
jgi:hypothetical protein